MPSKVPDYRRGRTHEEFCTTLVREGFAGTIQDVMDALDRVISARLPLLK